MRFAVACALSMTVGSAAAAPATKERIDSAYTKHDYEKCQKVSDEDPVTVRRCKGIGGISVTWTNEPDSSGIEFGKEEAVVSDELLGKLTFAVAPTTIEWRGVMKKGKLAPFATIARYSICGGIGGPCHDELVIFRLEGARRSCIAAVIDGRSADANARARQLADTFARTFDCDKDKPRTGEQAL